MKCNEIRFGSYDCAYNIMLPYLVTDPTRPEQPPQPKTVAVDKCLLPEVLKLWEMGIKTTGCCCGHGRDGMSFIGVRPEYIDRMKSLGYEVRFNECRPGDEDSFIPKTRLSYSNADKGFNWWDKYPSGIPAEEGEA
jgi:hypothetical protein